MTNLKPGRPIYSSALVKPSCAGALLIVVALQRGKDAGDQAFAKAVLEGNRVTIMASYITVYRTGRR